MPRKTILTSILAAILASVASVASAQNAPNVASIDAAKRGDPISPLIYGQFVEHLGRCVYGGIWAEMLQDRKFFDEPGFYPWERVGTTEFRNGKEGKFVGEASPMWKSESDDEIFGLEQSGLAFVKDRGYVGRVWAKLAPNQKMWIRLALGNGDRVIERALEKPTKTADDGYALYEFDFVADNLTVEKEYGAFSVRFQGKGETRLGAVSLMPDDNIDGMRADTLALLKELDAPIYRWPGGNFVSGYDWKDGVGERDRRPPRKNPAWQGIEHNDFGIHEFMNFCQYLGTLPDVAVNTGAGQLDSALEELEYVNGSPDSPQGKIRAANGHKEPYAVKYWCIGNEMFGDWQIGHMPTEEYAKKNNAFVDAFRKFDPNLTLISVGAVGAWDEIIMRRCADHMDWISEHFYVQERPDVVAHVELVPNAIRRIAQAHRKYREDFPELQDKNIKIAMDEWNYWYGPHVFGELGTRYFHKDGLGIAEGLHEYFRNSDIFAMANYAQTVNVIGCIKTSQTSAQFETTGLVLKLYRREFGDIPLQVEAPRPFDVAAATTDDGNFLTVAVVNPTAQAAPFKFEIKGLEVENGGERFEIANDDPKAFNDPDMPLNVKIERSEFSDSFANGTTLKPLSVSLFKVKIRK